MYAIRSYYGDAKYIQVYRLLGTAAAVACSRGRPGWRPKRCSSPKDMQLCACRLMLPPSAEGGRSMVGRLRREGCSCLWTKAFKCSTNCVITSYSIHYTKLYDDLLDRFGDELAGEPDGTCGDRPDASDRAGTENGDENQAPHHCIDRARGHKNQASDKPGKSVRRSVACGQYGDRQGDNHCHECAEGGDSYNFV